MARTLTARRLLRTLNEAKRDSSPPLNVDKWRGQLRDIRNQLIKLRDKAELELDRIEAATYRDDEVTPAEMKKLTSLEDHMTDCVDYVADAINQIDLCL